MSPKEEETLRVAGVDPERGFAGGESQVLGLTLELLRGGHQAELLCDPAGRLWKRARASRVTCHPLRIRNALDLLAGFRLRRLLRRERFDVVHFHTSRAHALAPFARGLGAVLVVTRRMDYVPDRRFAPYLYNRAVDAVVAISTGVADALAQAGVARESVTLIPSGVDIEQFRPPSNDERATARAALGLAQDCFAVGSVGALKPRKGHRYLLAAVASLRARVPGVRCFVAGEGSELRALREEVGQLRLGDSVTFAGGVEDPRALLWALDAFAFPSLKEGLGVALLEAMACGLPVVASNTGGLGDAIADGHSGLLVPPADTAALSRALERLAGAPGFRTALGAAARARVEQEFALSAMASRTLSLYRACIRRRRRDPFGGGRY